MAVVPVSVEEAARAAGEKAGPNTMRTANTVPIAIRCGVRLDKVRERRRSDDVHRDRRGREGPRSTRVDVSRVVDCRR